MFPCLKHAIFWFEFFVLKIGPDWGIFSRANMRGKNSLRHELPHTRNPGSVLATVHPVDSFWCLTGKLPRDFGLECVFQGVFNCVYNIVLSI